MSMTDWKIASPKIMHPNPPVNITLWGKVFMDVIKNLEMGGCVCVCVCECVCVLSHWVMSDSLQSYVL